MANRYWVGGAATPNWNENTGGITNWGTASGLRDNASVPTAADDVIFDNSANGNSPSTLSASIGIKSLDMSAYTNTFTHNNFNISLPNSGGDITLGAGMTYVHSSSSANFVINTYCTFTANGQLIPSITQQNGSGNGEITLGSDLTFAYAKSWSPPGNGSLNLNGFTISGASATARLLLTNFQANRYVRVQGGSFAYTDFMDVQLGNATSLDLSGIVGGSGDCGGNSIAGAGSGMPLTFTAPATQTWQGTSGGNWSDVSKWTSRIPLPQDDVVVSSVFSAGQTIVADMARLGKNIDFTGTTGNPTFALTSLQNSIFGSLTLVLDMTLSRTQILNFLGRGSHTVTLAGRGLGTNQLFFNSNGGTYTLMDDFSMPDELQHTRGGLVANNVNVSIRNLVSTGTNTRSLTLGTGTWTLSRINSIVWSVATTGLTFDGANATIVVGSTGNATRTFAGGGLTYGTLSYVLSGSIGALLVQGSNTFSTINFSDAANARTLWLTAGTTTTITSALNVNGTTGKLMTIESSTSGAPATLSKSGGIVSCQYLNLKDITATGGALWYAGKSSTDGTGNAGWTFAAPFKPLITFS